MEEIGTVYFDETQQNDQAEGIDLFHGPMAVITQGGNELMYSYNNVTQSLLRKVCTLHEKMKEKDKEIVKVKSENERLLQRIHELLIGAELREEAKESKARNTGSELLQIEIQDKTEVKTRRARRNGESYFVSWFKITCLLGLTIGTTAYLKETFEL